MAVFALFINTNSTLSPHQQGEALIDDLQEIVDQLKDRRITAADSGPIHNRSGHVVGQWTFG